MFPELFGIHLHELRIYRVRKLFKSYFATFSIILGALVYNFRADVPPLRCRMRFYLAAKLTYSANKIEVSSSFRKTMDIDSVCSKERFDVDRGVRLDLHGLHQGFGLAKHIEIFILEITAWVLKSKKI